MMMRNEGKQEELIERMIGHYIEFQEHEKEIDARGQVAHGGGRQSMVEERRAANLLDKSRPAYR
jgi:hypothetical protein